MKLQTCSNPGDEMPNVLLGTTREATGAQRRNQRGANTCVTHVCEGHGVISSLPGTWE